MNDKRVKKGLAKFLRLSSMPRKFNNSKRPSPFDPCLPSASTAEPRFYCEEIHRAHHKGQDSIRVTESGVKAMRTGKN